MPKLSPLKAEQVIRKLQKIGFEGPFAGGQHSRMVHPVRRQIIPDSAGFCGFEAETGVSHTKLPNRILKLSRCNL